jgi:hypothetical protein
MSTSTPFVAPGATATATSNPAGGAPAAAPTPPGNAGLDVFGSDVFDAIADANERLSAGAAAVGSGPNVPDLVQLGQAQAQLVGQTSFATGLMKAEVDTIKETARAV